MTIKSQTTETDEEYEAYVRKLLVCMPARFKIIVTFLLMQIDRMREQLKRETERAEMGWKTAKINDTARMQEMARRDQAEAKLHELLARELKTDL
jgi:hypothetical protein